MRIQVNVSEKMNERIEKAADEIGMTKSAYCNMLIAQGLMSYDRANQILQAVPEEFKNQLMKIAETK